MSNLKERVLLGGIRQLLNGTSRMSRKVAGGLGYYLLSKPRRLPEEPLSDTFIREAEQTLFFDREGTAINCYHWPGDGPSVLLLHGWESSTGRWFAFYDHLKRAGYDIYALDAPAHGRSKGRRFTVLHYANSLSDYLDQCSRTPDYWLAHSAGGMAAIYYLTEMQGRHQPQQLISMAVPGELEDFIDKFCAVIGVREKVKHGIDDTFRRKLDRNFSDISFIRYCAKLRIPGLIVHDEEDDVAPILGARRMHARWRGSRLLTFRGYGHSLGGDLVPASVVEYLRHC